MRLIYSVKSGMRKWRGRSKAKAGCCTYCPPIRALCTSTHQCAPPPESHRTLGGRLWRRSPRCSHRAVPALRRAPCRAALYRKAILELEHFFRKKQVSFFSSSFLIKFFVLLSDADHAASTALLGDRSRQRSELLCDNAC